MAGFAAGVRCTLVGCGAAAHHAIPNATFRDANGTIVWDGVVTNGNFELTNAAGQVYYFKRSP